jgi:hypothetical protein
LYPTAMTGTSMGFKRLDRLRRQRRSLPPKGANLVAAHEKSGMPYVHRPDSGFQHGCDPETAVAAALGGECDNVGCQRHIVSATLRTLA